MTNRYRGEIETLINGEKQTLRLSLSDLAELENTLSTRSLMQFVHKFENGEALLNDILLLIAKGLQKTKEAPLIEPKSMEFTEGVVEVYQLGAKLLKATFLGHTDYSATQ